MKHTKFSAILLVFFIAVFYSTSMAQEHPTSAKKDTCTMKHEHPTSSKTMKAHEHPTNTKKMKNHEHPTNAKSNKNHEHPEKHENKQAEHPSKHKKSHLTISEFASAVDSYVAAQTKKDGGYFLVKDKKQNKMLKLKLQKIHKKRLASLGNNEFFVCADFDAQDGKVYDIDIFMRGTSKNNLKATRTMVHKDNGHPRYTWYEDEGVWKTKKVMK